MKNSLLESLERNSMPNKQKPIPTKCVYSSVPQKILHFEPAILLDLDFFECSTAFEWNQMKEKELHVYLNEVGTSNTSQIQYLTNDDIEDAGYDMDLDEYEKSLQILFVSHFILWINSNFCQLALIHTMLPPKFLNLDKVQIVDQSMFRICVTLKLNSQFFRGITPPFVVRVSKMEFVGTEVDKFRENPHPSLARQYSKDKLVFDSITKIKSSSSSSSPTSSTNSSPRSPIGTKTSSLSTSLSSSSLTAAFKASPKPATNSPSKLKEITKPTKHKKNSVSSSSDSDDDDVDEFKTHIPQEQTTDSSSTDQLLMQRIRILEVVSNQHLLENQAFLKKFSEIEKENRDLKQRVSNLEEELKSFK